MCLSLISCIVFGLTTHLSTGLDIPACVNEPSSDNLEPDAIVRGTETEDGSAKYAVQILMSEYHYSHCTGTVISPTRVITAAHCLNDRETMAYIGVGSIHNGPKRFEDGIHIKIQEVVKDKRWDAENVRYDYAILKLASPIPDEHYAFALLANPQGSDNNVVNQKATALGWGLTSHNSSENTAQLMEVNLPLLPKNVCLAQYQDFVLEQNDYDPVTTSATIRETIQLGDEYLCANSLTGEGVCNGDSGGPLIKYRNTNKPVLIGITSFGMTDCGVVGAPTMFAKVSDAYDFINEHSVGHQWHVPQCSDVKPEEVYIPPAPKAFDIPACVNESSSDNLEPDAIVRGTETEDGSAKYAVQILMSEYHYSHCTGTVISPTRVITAAHCLNDRETMAYIGVGSIHNGPKRFEDGIHIKIQEVVKDKRWDAENVRYDYAILKLASPIPDEHYAFALLANPQGSDNNVVNQKATALGWGLTSHNSSENTAQLMEVNLPLLPKNVCLAQYQDFVLEQNDYDPVTTSATIRETIQLGDEYLCANSLTGEGVCNGDSGGPLIKYRNTNKPVLIGITSFGMTDCGVVGAPTMFAKVSDAYDFINEHSVGHQWHVPQCSDVKPEEVYNPEPFDDDDSSTALAPNGPCSLMTTMSTMIFSFVILYHA